MEIREEDRILARGSMGIEVDILIRIPVGILVAKVVVSKEAVLMEVEALTMVLMEVEALTMVLMDEAKVEEVGIHMGNHNASCVGSLGMWF